ncbi:MAG: hypothetical protein DRJ40_01225 [Thermoprotei archaeon]|nr:MAG: hypothetical protein DRJ40_01225 [Thermoprotei archaeon]
MLEFSRYNVRNLLEEFQRYEPRVCGYPECYSAGTFVHTYCREYLGKEVHVYRFEYEVPTWVVTTFNIYTFRDMIPVQGYPAYFSPSGGFVGRLLYLRNLSNLPPRSEVEGRCVLAIVTSRLSVSRLYSSLREHGAYGVLLSVPKPGRATKLISLSPDIEEGPVLATLPLEEALKLATRYVCEDLYVECQCEKGSGRVVDVIAVIEGKKDSGVLLLANLDSKLFCPGYVDNLSGVIGILEFARAYVQLRRRCSDVPSLVIAVTSSGSYSFYRRVRRRLWEQVRRITDECGISITKVIGVKAIGFVAGQVTVFRCREACRRYGLLVDVGKYVDCREVVLVTRVPNFFSGTDMDLIDYVSVDSVIEGLEVIAREVIGNG